jgi:hypothetical protein
MQAPLLVISMQSIDEMTFEYNLTWRFKIKDWNKPEK